MDNVYILYTKVLLLYYVFIMLTIATWNINGIRAVKGPLRHHLDVLNSDIMPSGNKSYECVHSASSSVLFTTRDGLIYITGAISHPQL